MSKKLHICCGDVYLHGYHNIDIYGDSPNGSNPNVTNLSNYYREEFGSTPRTPIIDECVDIREPWRYSDNSFDEIVMISAIEHFTHEEAKHIVSEVKRVLRNGGRWIVDFPDIEATVAMFNDEPEFMIRLIYGSYKNSHCVHKWGYTPKTFLKLLDGGWTDIIFQTIVSHDYPMVGVVAIK